MNTKTVFAFLFLLSIAFSCKQDVLLVEHQPEDGPLQVRFQDITTSCTWNLVTLNNELISDFQQTRQDSFLHSDINQFEEAQNLQFGDTLTIEYEVLETVPDGYEAPLNICNRHTGIVIKILAIIE